MATVSPLPRTTSMTLASPSAGPFDVGFRLFEADALKVYVDSEVSTDFTVDATFVNGYDDDAQITFGATLAAATVVVIDGDMTPSRDDDYINGPNLVALMNIELARAWATLSELKMRLDRAALGLDPALTLEDVQGIVAAAGSVPSPSGGQTGYLMQATGAGAYGWISRAVALGAALEAVRGLTPAADRLPYFNGPSGAALATLTAFARTLLDDADAAAMQATLGLGALALLSNITTAQIAAATLVTASETIAANNNDTTIPTSAAVSADRKFTWATVGNLLIGPTQDVAIPSGVTEIVVNVPIGVSLDGADDFIVRLGDSGGIKSTGYYGQSVLSATSTVALSTDFRVPLGLASRAWAGHMRLHLDAALVWRWSFFGSVTGNLVASGAGEIGLASELTTLRFTRSGTNNFDAGTSLRVGYR